MEKPLISRFADLVRQNKELTVLAGITLAAGASIGLIQKDTQDSATEAAVSAPTSKSNIETISKNPDKPDPDKPEPAPTIKVRKKRKVSVPEHEGPPFKLSEYKVPGEGAEITRSTAAQSDKNVIYILDFHNNSRVVSDYQSSIQTEIFEIVEDLVNKYGTVPVVMEAWNEGVSASDYAENIHEGHSLYGLFHAPNLEERLGEAESILKHTKLAGPVIVGTFQNRVIPIGTMDDGDKRAANELVRRDRRLHRAAHKNKTFCKGTDGKSYDFYTARDGFRSGTSPETTHCYCAVHEYESRLMESYKQRLEEVPVREVKYALEVDHDFVAVISGYKHWRSAKKELDKQGVNYITIAPRTFAEGDLSADYFKVYFPDDAAGTCERLMRENGALVEAAIGRI